jgi:hypothetical protein
MLLCHRESCGFIWAIRIFGRLCRRRSSRRSWGPPPHEHTHARMQSPRVQDLPLEGARLSEAPFKGITTHGSGWPGLFLLRPEDGDEYGIDLLSLHYEQAYHSGRTLRFRFALADVEFFYNRAGSGAWNHEGTGPWILESQVAERWFVRRRRVWVSRVRRPWLGKAVRSRLTDETRRGWSGQWRKLSPPPACGLHR